MLNSETAMWRVLTDPPIQICFREKEIEIQRDTFNVRDRSRSLYFQPMLFPLCTNIKPKLKPQRGFGRTSLISEWLERNTCSLPTRQSERIKPDPQARLICKVDVSNRLTATSGLSFKDKVRRVSFRLSTGTTALSQEFCKIQALFLRYPVLLIHIRFHLWSPYFPTSPYSIPSNS